MRIESLRVVGGLPSHRSIILYQLTHRDPRVLHIITDLDTGGAEAMLLDLVRAASDVKHRVLSLSTIGPIGPRIAELGYGIEALRMRRGPTDLVRLGSLVSRIRRASPDVVHTWMIHANVIGGLACLAARRPPVVWSLHHSTLDPTHTPRTTIALDRLAARLSRAIPTRTVGCSRAALRLHAAAGYDASRMLFIPNGVDTNRFRPNPIARSEVRAELGIAPDTELIGVVARFHPQKDFPTFVACARDRKSVV